MKKLITFRRSLTIVSFATLIILSSCDKIIVADKETVEKEKTEYINQLNEKDSTITELTAKLKRHSELLELLHNELYEETVNKNSVIELFRGFDFFADKGKLCKTIVDLMKLREKNAITIFMGDRWYFYKGPDYERFSANNELGVMRILWNNIDRNTAYINAFLTEDVKQSIYAVFEDNTIYEDSGMSLMVSALLTAYNEIEMGEESNSHFFHLKQMLYDNSEESESYEHWKECRRIANELLVSEEVMSILSDESYATSSSNYIDVDHMIFYTYSFWCRRDREGNSEAVYQLLSEFHQNVAKY
ncbi:hypothetical protein [Fulvivirga sediminis]|uniref:Lipoprotein n=1 Tax=Fulvivirga sediminis TaxID=2803949 RepID=A0A937FD75_9BACT|nr:hypothetical protein [Fulvivirga sediminis]MBL3658755.1 hypothetical protein [Fulvivirga sediminis]